MRAAKRMTMRVGVCACAALLAACSASSASPANPSRAEPASDAASIPDVPGDGVDPNPQPASAPSPVVQPEVTAPAEPPPTKREALKASKAVLKGKLAQLAPIVPLSPSTGGRAAVVWRSVTGVAEASVELVVLAKADGVWAVQSHVQVTSAATPWLGDEPPPFAVTTRADDYDNDGDAEILVRVRAPVMCPGGGPNTITQMTIFDLTPTLEPVLATELRHAMDAQPDEATKASVTYRDVDGDGHGDVEIAYVSKSEGVTHTATNLWTYVPDKDAWVLGNSEYARWGCEW